MCIAARARAADVSFTLALDYPVLEAALQRTLGLRQGPVVVWGTAGGCRALELRDVRVTPDGERVRVDAGGAGRVGFDLGGFCVLPLQWDGTLATRANPVVGDDWQLRLRDLESTLLDHHGESTFVGRRLWGLFGEDVDGALAEFAFDLSPPADETRALLRACAPPERAAPVLETIASLRPGEVSVTPTGITVRVTLTVPDVAPEPPAPEAPLTPEERAAWDAALDRWDAFLVFVVKDLGILAHAPAIRSALFDVLLSSRHELLDVLSAGPQPGEDPVRRLFLDAWNQLRDVVRQAALAGDLGDHALRYVAFLAAGDALATLDVAAPGLGLEISADGLRRLARILEPAARDPLVASDQPDPVLRELFGFHEPESSGAASDPSSDDPPSTGDPSSETTPSTTVPPGHQSGLRSRAERDCAVAPPPDEMPSLGTSLDRWVPPPDQLPRYRDLVSRLLDLTAAREGERGAVGPSFRELYRQLVRTTAWQESCWRQFVEENGRVTFLRSVTDDVGIMQVNRRVWRGFFDLRKLEWDIVYNAGAGAEILAQLLVRYGEREAAHSGGHAARACYSAYNGGPAAHTRYRRERVRARDRDVDRAFWKKFQITAAGQELDQVLCTPFGA